MVVSIASWAPRNKINPSATTSSPLPSKTLKAARSKSLWTRELQPPCKSLQQPPPEDIHPKTLPRHAARRWPNMSSWRHIGRYAESEEGRDAIFCTEGCGKGWVSICVVLDVGSAVNGIDANGPCWDRKRARWESSSQGHISSRMNLCSDIRVRNRGSTFQRVQGAFSSPLSPTRPMNSNPSGGHWPTQSTGRLCQTRQHVKTQELRGPKMVGKQFHTSASWRVANASVSGRTARGQKLARAKRSQAA